MKKYKPDIIFFSLLAIAIVAVYYLAVVVLPFFVGLALAFMVNPFIRKIQRLIPNRNVAITMFLVAVVAVFASIILLFASQISHDFKRLNRAFVTYAQSNSELLDETTQTIKSYIDKVYSPELLKEQLGIDIEQDSLSFNDMIQNINKDSVAKKLDWDAIKQSFSSLTSFFNSSQNNPETKSKSSHDLNWLIIFLSSIGYFFYIVYSLDYFEKGLKKYFSNSHSEKFNRVFQEVKRTFLSYFKQRTKIVLIYTLIYITAFLIIGIPGAIILGLIAGFLSYISYFQYITLIPIALGCMILSIEHDPGFLFYFGITFGVFVMSSLLEEFYLYDKIMKDVKGMNLAVMMVSIAVWGYLLGTVGVLIALPLTSLIMAYVKQILLYVEKKRNVLNDSRES